MINTPEIKRYYYFSITLLLLAVVMFADLLFSFVLRGLLNNWFFETLLINMCLLFAVFYALAIYNEKILNEIKELKEVKND